MKYKTIGLYYGNGESNLIHEMSTYGWGLINKMPPDYPSGQKEAFYTFVGGDDAQEVDHVDHTGSVTPKQPNKISKRKRNVLKNPRAIKNQTK